MRERASKIKYILSFCQIPRATRLILVISSQRSTSASRANAPVSPVNSTSFRLFHTLVGSFQTMIESGSPQSRILTRTQQIENILQLSERNNMPMISVKSVFRY